jgi:hypothetical protein
MKKFLLFSAFLIAALCNSFSSHAQESFPEIHNQPIVIHFLDAGDASPQVHLHVILVAGYSQDDLRRSLWWEERTTDSRGDLQLPQAMINLPWVQVFVAQGKRCSRRQAAQTLSVERIRSDGMSSRNVCGLAAAKDKPGELNFFVQTPGPSADKDRRSEPEHGANGTDR